MALAKQRRLGNIGIVGDRRTNDVGVLQHGYPFLGRSCLLDRRNKRGKLLAVLHAICGTLESRILDQNIKTKHAAKGLPPLRLISSQHDPDVLGGIRFVGSRVRKDARRVGKEWVGTCRSRGWGET